MHATTASIVAKIWLRRHVRLRNGSAVVTRLLLRRNASTLRGSVGLVQFLAYFVAAVSSLLLLRCHAVLLALVTLVELALMR
jgi:hypothetical protein